MRYLILYRQSPISVNYFVISRGWENGYFKSVIVGTMMRHLHAQLSYFSSLEIFFEFPLQVEIFSFSNKRTTFQTECDPAGKPDYFSQ